MFSVRTVTSSPLVACISALMYPSFSSGIQQFFLPSKGFVCSAMSFFRSTHRNWKSGSSANGSIVRDDIFLVWSSGLLDYLYFFPQDLLFQKNSYVFELPGNNLLWNSNCCYEQKVLTGYLKRSTNRIVIRAKS